MRFVKNRSTWYATAMEVELASVLPSAAEANVERPSEVGRDRGRRGRSGEGSEKQLGGSTDGGAECRLDVTTCRYHDHVVHATKGYVWQGMEGKEGAQLRRRRFFNVLSDLARHLATKPSHDLAGKEGDGLRESVPTCTYLVSWLDWSASPRQLFVN